MHLVINRFGKIYIMGYPVNIFFTLSCDAKRILLFYKTSMDCYERPIASDYMFSKVKCTFL